MSNSIAEILTKVEPNEESSLSTTTSYVPAGNQIGKNTL
jgi:hypothetical protein